MSTTVLAKLMPETPTFLDDLTPESSLSLRRWNREEYYRMSYPVIFGPEERTELIYGEVMVLHEGTPRLFTRQEYYRLAEYDILKPDERTELIYGRVIVHVSPMGRPHSVALLKATDIFRAIFDADFVVETQMPLQVSAGSDPEPDLLVVAGRPDDYADAPKPEDVKLLLEVSDSTLRYDRGPKATLYAKGGVSDYWLINLRMRTLEVRRQPEDGEYMSLEVYHEDETVAPLSVPGSPVRVADLLPLVR